MNRLHHCLCFLLFLATAGYSQEMDSLIVKSKGTIKPLADVIEDLEKKTDYIFYYRRDEIDSIMVVPPAALTEINEFLRNLLDETGLRFIIDSNKNVFISEYPFSEDPVVSGFYFDDSVISISKAKEFKEEKDVETTLSRDQSIGNKLYELGRQDVRTPSGKAILSGYVRSSSGVALEGTSVQILKTEIGTMADENGFYSLTLSPGMYELLIKRVGMKDTRRLIALHGNASFDIEIEEEATRLEEVVVQSGDLSALTRPTPGIQKLSIAEIMKVPTVFGETDIIRVILTLPGVKSVGEASTGFNVRGGASDQNLILYDDITIFNPSHFFGFFSAFNAETIKGVELYKSNIPARYGGRLSSVLQVFGKDGESKNIKGSAGVGLLTSRLNLEGPIVNENTSFVIGARTTYSDWLFKLLPETSGYGKTRASFYDINGSIRHKANDKNAFSITGYLSSDESNLNTDTVYNYSNRSLSGKWTHTFNSKLSTSVVATHDRYGYSNRMHSDSTSAYRMDFLLKQQVFKVNCIYTPREKHIFEFGVNSTLFQIQPGSLARNHPASEVIPVSIAQEKGIENAFYFEDQFDLNERFSINAGLRYSFYYFLGPQNVRDYPANVPRTRETIIDTTRYGGGKIVKTYGGLDYRLSARFSINDGLSIKAGLATTRQFLHMLSNTVAISPTDTWKLSDSHIAPQHSVQISAGLYKTLFSSSLEISVEGYSKRISNYLDYKSGAKLLVNPHVETEVFTTKGKAYGIEVMIKKPKGEFNGWLSYTYARTFLKMDDPIAGEKINDGEYYPASFDKPHDFSFSGNQKVSRRFSVSMNLTYSTGRPVTIPVGIFYYGGVQKTLYSSRNGYRIPDYFRTDLSVNIEGNHKVHQRTHNSWSIGLYNLFGRKNPYSIYFISDNGVVKGYKLSIFGACIPFINYNIRF